MNESFIHHVVRVALILGVLIGLSGFALLLYAADFWSVRNRSAQIMNEMFETPPTEPPQAENRSFGERTVYWMFGEPEPNQK